MPYESHLRPDGILWLKFLGNIELEDWMAYEAEYTPLVEAFTEAHPLNFLVDASEIGKISASARKALLKAFANPDPRFGNTAILSANRYVRVLASFILKATGRNNIHIFDTEEEALAWLQGRR
jgi:hypothetical protein